MPAEPGEAVNGSHDLRGVGKRPASNGPLGVTRHLERFAWLCFQVLRIS